MVVDLETLQDDSTQPEAATVAKHFIEHYSFPVVMVVAYPNGTIAHKVNANTFLDEQPNLIETGFLEPSSAQYLRFLKEGITRVEQGRVAEISKEDQQHGPH